MGSAEILLECIYFLRKLHRNRETWVTDGRTRVCVCVGISLRCKNETYPVIFFGGGGWWKKKYVFENNTNVRKKKTIWWQYFFPDVSRRYRTGRFRNTSVVSRWDFRKKSLLSKRTANKRRGTMWRWQTAAGYSGGGKNSWTVIVPEEEEEEGYTNLGINRFYRGRDSRDRRVKEFVSIIRDMLRPSEVKWVQWRSRWFCHGEG